MTNNDSLRHFAEVQTVRAALLETLLDRAQVSIASAEDDNAVQTARDRLADDLAWLAKVGGVK